MKIAIVCPNDFSVVTFCGALVRLLQHDGENEVYAVCDTQTERPDGHFAEQMKTWGVTHLPIRYYRFMSVRRDLRYLATLYRILRKERFDMVVNIATKANVYGSIAAKCAGVERIVCSVWGLGVTFGEASGVRTRITRRLVLALYWIGFRASSKVWLTNTSDFQLLVESGVLDPAQAFVTKNYVNANTYSPSSVSVEQVRGLRSELALNVEDKVVVMVARMSWAKGVKQFVEAAGILRHQLPALKFVLVGPMDTGSSDAVPEEYLRYHARYSNFIWTGFREDVRAFYGMCDVAVLPSYYREGGYPRGLTEAMCMGKPIVTTDSVHCRATVEHGKNGYHVPVKDSHALADAITRIVTNDDLRREFGRYSRSKALREFDEDIIVEEVVRRMFEPTTTLPERAET